MSDDPVQFDWLQKVSANKDVYVIWPFRPRSPLSLTHQVACERRFAAVVKLLGKHRCCESTVLTPQDLDAIIRECSAEEFPQRLFAFITSRFPFPVQPVNVVWGDKDAMAINGTALTYTFGADESGKIHTIGFQPVLAEMPERLAGVVAAAASEFVIRSEKLAENVPIGTFEILPLFYGLGPVMTNAALHEFSQGGAGYERWDMSRVGRVSSLEFGYTMALSDWVMKTGYFDLADTMRPDAKETFQKALRFLEKTGDCYFDQDVFAFTSQDINSTAADRLRSSNNSRKLGTLHDLVVLESVPSALMHPITEQLNHREDEIQRVAAAALGKCETLTQPIHDELLMMSEQAPVAIRRAAVSSLRPGFDNDEHVLDTLGQLLKKADATSATICIRTLLKYNTYPEGMVDSLLKGLSTMVLTLEAPDLQLGVDLLKRLCDDPAAVMHQHFEGDPTAIAIFDELLNPSEDDSTESQTATA